MSYIAAPTSGYFHLSEKGVSLFKNRNFHARIGLSGSNRCKETCRTSANDNDFSANYGRNWHLASRLVTLPEQRQEDLKRKEEAPRMGAPSLHLKP
jgi:hypothetical protein